jgi:hypothetical protein
MLPLKLGAWQQEGQQCHLSPGLYDFTSEIELWELIFYAALKSVCAISDFIYIILVEFDHCSSIMT